MMIIIINSENVLGGARTSKNGCLDAAVEFHVSVTPMPKNPWAVPRNQVLFALGVQWWQLSTPKTTSSKFIWEDSAIRNMNTIISSMFNLNPVSGMPLL